MGRNKFLWFYKPSAYVVLLQTRSNGFPCFRFVLCNSEWPSSRKKCSPPSLQHPPSLSKSSSRWPSTENQALSSSWGLQESQELPSFHLCSVLSPQAVASRSVYLQQPHRHTFSSLQKAQLKSSCSFICWLLSLSLSIKNRSPTLTELFTTHVQNRNWCMKGHQ